jgi:hypothetical protein
MSNTSASCRKGFWRTVRVGGSLAVSEIIVELQFGGESFDAA